MLTKHMERHLSSRVICCCCSVAKSCPTLSAPQVAAQQASPPLTTSRRLPKFTCIESTMPTSHLLLCRPLLLLPSIFPSIRVFANKLALPIRWPKYWSFSFSISSSSEYLGLISFGTDWCGLLAVQWTVWYTLNLFDD